MIFTKNAHNVLALSAKVQLLGVIKQNLALRQNVQVKVDKLLSVESILCFKQYVVKESMYTYTISCTLHIGHRHQTVELSLSELKRLLS